MISFIVSLGDLSDTFFRILRADFGWIALVRRDATQGSWVGSTNIRTWNVETRRQGQEAGAGKKPGRAGGPGNLMPTRNEYAGIVLSLSKQEHPDTSAYDDPEIVYRVNKRHHAGLIVRSKKLERVEELLTQYAARFADDFVAVVPPLEKAE